jgi:hypothetical protein
MPRGSLASAEPAAGRAPLGEGALAARLRALSRVDIALIAVFALAAVYYAWISSTWIPFSLHDPRGDRYNLLANALLHFRLSIGPAPAALVHSSEPYNPISYIALQHGPNDVTSINDDVMYKGALYFLWGPAPALVLLVPLRLLGFIPSPSVTVAVFGIAGMGFALATLRVLIRRIDHATPTWMCVLAAGALSLSSAVPFVLGNPSVSEDTLAGGYCFMMAGVWLAVAALADRTASSRRLVLMSLCFGLAAGSRPALGLAGIVLVPVYLAVRGTVAPRKLLVSLALPIGVCGALMLAYNQARFGTPLEFGSHHQLTAYDSRTAPFSKLSYVLPGLGFYAFTPPQPSIVFPFFRLVAPQATAPAGLGLPEYTGGLLPTVPIVAFVVALPWLWRRGPAQLGMLAPALLLLVGAGVIMAALPSYGFFSSTERYEAEFATLILLPGLAAWLALSSGARTRRRSALRVGGAVLVLWGCVMGFAISVVDYGRPLASTHPSLWRSLEDIGSPLSTAIAIVIGHPVVADVSSGPVALDVNEYEGVTVVSPDARRAVLSADVETPTGTLFGLRVSGPNGASQAYRVSESSGRVTFPLQLSRGINRVRIAPVALSKNDGSAALVVGEVSLGG